MMRPAQAGFELTKMCNYYCKHCFSNAGFLSHELTFNEVQHVFDELYDLGILFINMTGGEPTLRQDIAEILEYTLRFGEAQVYHFQTNGTTWTREFLEKFLQICAKQPSIDVQISLDGYDRASYVEARGGLPENFDRMVELTTSLRKHDIEVNALMTITKSTLPHAMKTARFAVNELDVEKFLMIPLFPAGRAVPNYSELEFSREMWKKLLTEVTLLKRDQAWGDDTERIQVGFFTLYDFVLPLEEAGLEREIKDIWNFSEDTFGERSKRPHICESGYTDLFIDIQGVVFPCTPAIGSDFVAGNVFTESLSSIWENSSVLNWFRTEAPKVCEREPCKSCSHNHVCGGGCRVAALQLSGDRNALDPVCPTIASWEGGIKCV